MITFLILTLVTFGIAAAILAGLPEKTAHGRRRTRIRLLRRRFMTTTYRLRETIIKDVSEDVKAFGRPTDDYGSEYSLSFSEEINEYIRIPRVGEDYENLRTLTYFRNEYGRIVIIIYTDSQVLADGNLGNDGWFEIFDLMEAVRDGLSAGELSIDNGTVLPAIRISETENKEHT